MSETTFGDAVSAFDAANSTADSGDNTPAPSSSEPPPSYSQTKQTGEQAPVQPTITNSNPAYAEHLQKIPEGFRGVVEPIFKEWDQNVNKRFDQVHSKYEPYKQLIESGAQPDQMAQALNLFQRLDADPIAFYNVLHDHLTQQGLLQGQGQEEPEDDEEYDLGDGQQRPPQQDLRIAQLEQQHQALIQGMERAQQARAEQETEQWLDRQIKDAETYLNDKHGIKANEGTWNYILNVAAGINQSNGGNSGAAFAKAVDMYVDNVNQFRQMPTANSTAPAVLPTSGGLPSSNGIPENISDKDRRQLAVDMFRQALKDS